MTANVYIIIIRIYCKKNKSTKIIYFIKGTLIVNNIINDNLELIESVLKLYLFTYSDNLYWLLKFIFQRFCICLQESINIPINFTLLTK